MNLNESKNINIKIIYKYIFKNKSQNKKPLNRNNPTYFSDDIPKLT